MEKSKINAVRGRLGELRMSITSFSKEIGISKNRAFAILNGERPYTSIEIERACHVLKIPAELIPDYFFGTVVTKSATNIAKSEE